MAQRAERAPLPQVTFDTDVLIWYLRGNEKAKALLAQVPFEKRTISSLVYMELLQGCLDAKEMRAVEKFVAQNFCQFLHLSEPISQRAIALLEKYALSHGLRVADALIAATALLLRLKLVTANRRHYHFIKGLDLLPFSPE